MQANSDSNEELDRFTSLVPSKASSMARESNKDVWTLRVAIGLYLGLLLLSLLLIPLPLMPVPMVLLGIPTLFATIQPLLIRPPDPWTIWTRLGIYISY